MITLLLTVFLVVLISAICSMTEAALYSVPWTYIENLRKQGSATGELLYQLRSRIDQPIAAVLTLNTVANTAGAAIAGAVAANVLGADNTALFAAGLTILILALGEILPKTLGVAHACGVASGMARPLRLMVLIFKPFIWFSSMLTRLVASPQSGPSATEDDIRAITSLSRQTGRIQQYEENAIRNILSLDVKHVREIMTPRTMVFSLQEDISVKDAYNHPQIWHYSRIPVYGDDNEDIVGIVLRKDIGRYVSQGQGEKTLFDIMQPVRFVLENQTVDKLLLEFLESRLHLFIVLDEYGGLAGVVSLEDVLEEMLGREIVDETDAVADLREAARQRRSALTQARNQQNAALKAARADAAKESGEAARQESHLLEKGKELFSEIFFECCPFCSTVPYSEKAFKFLSSLKQEKPPEYPRGLFLCPENVRQAVSQRLYSPGRARYCGRGLPLGEKAEGGHCGISPASPLLRVPFYLSGGSDWPPPRL